MESLFKNYRVYIIGQLPVRMSSVCRNKFAEAEKLLAFAGFNSIINPLTAFEDDSIPREEAYRRNFSNLIHSQAVFVLSSASARYNENIELKIAMDLNLMIMHDKIQVVDEYESSPENKHGFTGQQNAL